jgi:hypothetical protein
MTNITNINLLHVSAPGVPTIGSLSGIQAQHLNLGMLRPHWNDENIKIVKYVKVTGIDLQCCDIKTM